MPDRPAAIGVGATARVVDSMPVPTDVPAHLRPATADWYRQVVRTWVLDAHHERILQAAAEAWDLSQSAREVLARDGLTVPTRDGGCKAHPLLTVATVARAHLASFIAQLDLDDDADVPGDVR
jgi:P27 family predicted phage terminase small subunit